MPDRQREGRHADPPRTEQFLGATAPGDGATVHTVYRDQVDQSSANIELMPFAIDAAEFSRQVVELGLVRADQLERISAETPGGVADLARALFARRAITAYQAGAILQGKAHGLVIGNYLIQKRLGSGGMGVVFKAKHRRLGREVALKILPPSFGKNASSVERFRREAKAAAILAHPNVVSVIDADEDRGVHFLVMEYLRGSDLDKLVRECGPLPIGQTLDFVIQAARGLDAAHARGIIHRDIKPANLMVDAAGVVRVLDLGLARVLDDAGPLARSDDGRLTHQGAYMGTVDYMAPEQAEDSRTADHRADIYGLGCTMHTLLIGEPPFRGDTLMKRLLAHQITPPPPLNSRRPEIPTALDAVYQRMLAKRPDGRPASMAEVARLLQSCRDRAVESRGARTGRPEVSRAAADASEGESGSTYELEIPVKLAAMSDERDESAWFQIERPQPQASKPAKGGVPAANSGQRLSSAGLAWAVAAGSTAFAVAAMIFIVSRETRRSDARPDAPRVEADRPPPKAPAKPKRREPDAAGPRGGEVPPPPDGRPPRPPGPELVRPDR